MKKIFFLILTCISIFTFLGCASNSVIDVKQMESIAIIQMSVNDEVTMLGNMEDGGGIFTKYLTMRNDDINPISTLKLGALAEASLYIALEKYPEFLDKQTVTSVRAYEKQEPSVYKKMYARPIEGYKLYSENDKQKNAYILDELNAKYGMFVRFYFNKTNFSNDIDNKYGDMHAAVGMEVIIKDIKGKTYYEKFFENITDDYTHVSSGTLNELEKEAMAKLFPSAINAVIAEFMKDFVEAGSIN